MIDKTRLGISFFDERYGGLFRKRPALCIGRQGSGKTLTSVQALLQSVQEGERGLMLSTWRAHDLAILAAKMNLPLAQAVTKGQVVLLEYADLIPTPQDETNWTLPPGSFLELQEIVASNGVSRVIIDSILPWVAIQPEKKLAHHVFSFIQAFERMGVTAIFTLPRPVSPLAFALKNRLEEQIPIVFTLDYNVTGQRTLLINKYLGELNLPPPMNFVIAPGTGIIRAPKLIPAAAQTGSAAAGSSQNTNATFTSPIRFSSVFHT